MSEKFVLTIILLSAGLLVIGWASAIKRRIGARRAKSKMKSDSCRCTSEPGDCCVVATADTPAFIETLSDVEENITVEVEFNEPENLEEAVEVDDHDLIMPTDVEEDDEEPYLLTDEVILPKKEEDPMEEQEQTIDELLEEEYKAHRDVMSEDEIIEESPKSETPFTDRSLAPNLEESGPAEQTESENDPELVNPFVAAIAVFETVMMECMYCHDSMIRGEAKCPHCNVEYYYLDQWKAGPDVDRYTIVKDKLSKKIAALKGTKDLKSLQKFRNRLKQWEKIHEGAV